MTNSGSDAWQLARVAESLKFMLGDLEDRRKTIRLHAWHESSWRVVYQESTAMKATVNEMQATLSELCTILEEKARTT